MALQTFTAGQVLTAAQVTALQANDYNQTVNNYTDSRVLTIADLGDRVVMNKATATTITVNTGIFAAGDTLWIHNIGAGVCTITAGTATVSTSGSLALAQNSGGTLYFTSTGVAIFFPTVAASAQGLTLLNTTSFSAVSSQNITAFSSDYSNYKMVVKFSAFSTSPDVRLRLSASGVDDTSSNYNFGYRYVRSSGANGDVQNNLLSYMLIGYGIAAQPEDCRFTADIVSPFLAERTSVMGSGTWNDATSWLSVTGAGAHRVSTSYNGISLATSTGTMSGIVSIYGYNK